MFARRASLRQIALAHPWSQPQSCHIYRPDFLARQGEKGGRGGADGSSASPGLGSGTWCRGQGSGVRRKQWAVGRKQDSGFRSQKSEETTQKVGGGPLFKDTVGIEELLCGAKRGLVEFL